MSVVLGTTRGKGDLTLSPKDRSTHLQVVGASGRGKSKFLENLIFDQLKKFEKKGRKKFRRKHLRLWRPVFCFGVDLWTNAFDRAEKVTKKIKKRKRYCPLLSEAAFERIFWECVTVWYWSGKPKKNQKLHPSVEKAVRAQVDLFVTALGKKKKKKKKKK